MPNSPNPAYQTAMRSSSGPSQANQQRLDRIEAAASRTLREEALKAEPLTTLPPEERLRLMRAVLKAEGKLKRKPPRAT